MDEIGAYYVEGSKPERETPVEYIKTCIWNVERGNKDPVIQTVKQGLCNPDSKTDTYVKKIIWDYVAESKSGVIWEDTLDMFIISYVKQIHSGDLLYDSENSTRGSVSI